jgi:hypothetical protein
LLPGTKYEALWRFLKHLQHPIELTRTRRQISAKFIEARRESADASRRRVTDQQIPACR